MKGSLAVLLFCIIISCVYGVNIKPQHKESIQTPSGGQYYTCYYNNGHWSMKTGVADKVNGVAWAYYAQEIDVNGWAYISITTNPLYPDMQQTYAAGFLEGAVSADLIYYNWQNTYINEYDSKPVPDVLTQWITTNNAFMMQKIKENPTDPYWIQVALTMEQVVGMSEGYASVTTDPTKDLTVIEFLLLNMDGDMGDLGPALNISGVDWTDEASILKYWVYHTHCSALVRVADDFSEIYAGHTTWTDYYQMVRMFKSYNFSLSEASQTKSKISVFSSYPASLSSIDDFYVLDTGLTVIETTNGVMNNSLWQYVTPNSVLSWIRVILTNRMAVDGATWVETFSECNSGTYNNQWIIVDHNKLIPGIGINNGSLYILEQIPGHISSLDVTEYLLFGYWPSFNVPFFDYIYEVSGFAEAAKQYGTLFTYENNPRNEIFRRDVYKVEDIPTMQKMLRYNNWANDALSLGNAGLSISARFDLVVQNTTNPFLIPAPFGGVDSKVTSSSLVKNVQTWAQSGPTHDDLPPFQWGNNWNDITHVGQPDKWDFDWVLFGPDYNQN